MIFRLWLTMVLLSCYGPSYGAIYKVQDPAPASPFFVFRDSDQPSNFYIIPTQFGLTAPNSTQPRLGIQIFADPKHKSNVSASITLSVSPSLSSAQIATAISLLKQKFALIDIKLTPAPRLMSRISIYAPSIGPTALASTKWTSAPVEASQSLSFTIANISRSSLARVLAGQDDGLVILLEAQIDGLISRVATARISSSQLSSLGKSSAIISSGIDYNQFIDAVLDQAVEASPSDKPFIREAVSDWVRRQLGSATLIRRAGRLTYGWDVSDMSVKPDDGSIKVNIGAGHSETFGSIIRLGNVCQTNGGAILNIDDGSSGCAGLR